jgi:hypothetical protein
VTVGGVAIRVPDVRFARLSLWASRTASLVVFALLPAFLTARLMFQHGFGWDFRAFYEGANAYFHGASPYPHDSLGALADKQEFGYPAPTALLLAPLALLPYTAALAVWLTPRSPPSGWRCASSESEIGAVSGRSFSRFPPSTAFAWGRLDRCFSCFWPCCGDTAIASSLPPFSPL